MIKPEQMNGQIIPDEEIHEMLELANWAPTHGHTEPWRFVIFSRDGLTNFSSFHANLYKKVLMEKGCDPVKYQKILTRTQNISHLIALGMKRGDNAKIPANEEHISAGIAAQHIWLGAAAKGIACYWGSGGMTYHPEMKEFLGLNQAEDRLLGFLYLGYSDLESRPGKRLTGIDAKTDWRT